MILNWFLWGLGLRCHWTFWSLFCSTQGEVLCFWLLALWSRCAFSTSALLLCRVHTHTHTHYGLFADSGFVILTGQTFEAVPAAEHSELIILTSYSPPSRSRSATGTENSFVESLRRTWRIRKCLKSTLNDVWNQPQNNSAPLLSEKWCGNEFMGLTLAALQFWFFFSLNPREEERLRVQIGQRSRSWWGVNCMLPTWYFTHLTECPFMWPYFIPSDRVIWNHLDLTFKSSHVGALTQECHARINQGTHFNLDGSHTSPILLCLRILLI